MGDRDDGAGVLLEVLLQPRDALGVEVVGGLVEQQQVGRLEQQLAQRDAAALTTGEDRDVGVPGRAAQRVHGLLDAGVELPAVGVLDDLHQLALLGQQRVEVGVGLPHRRADLLEAGQRVAERLDRLLDVAAHVELLVERRLLLQDARRCSPGESVASPLEGCSMPAMILRTVDLPAPLGPTHADLRAGQERQGDVVEDHLVAVRLARTDHRVDVLSHWAVEPSVVSRSGAGRRPAGPAPVRSRLRSSQPGATRRARAAGEVVGVHPVQRVAGRLVVPTGGAPRPTREAGGRQGVPRAARGRVAAADDSPVDAAGGPVPDELGAAPLQVGPDGHGLDPRLAARAVRRTPSCGWSGCRGR